MKFCEFPKLDFIHFCQNIVIFRPNFSFQGAQVCGKRHRCHKFVFFSLCHHNVLKHQSTFFSSPRCYVAIYSIVITKLNRDNLIYYSFKCLSVKVFSIFIVFFKENNWSLKLGLIPLLLWLSFYSPFCFALEKVRGDEKKWKYMVNVSVDAPEWKIWKLSWDTRSFCPQMESIFPKRVFSSQSNLARLYLRR